MPDYRAGLGAATSGAIVGSSFGPVGTVVGGAAGFLSGALSESPAEARERRIAAYRRRLATLRQEEHQQAVQTIGAERNALQNRLTSGATRRARALGRPGDVEAFTAPAVGEVANVATGNLARASYDIDQRYNRAELDLEGDIFSAPIEPNFADYFQTAASGVGDFMNADRVATALEGMGGDAVTRARGLIGGDIPVSYDRPPVATYTPPGSNYGQETANSLRRLQLRR